MRRWRARKVRSIRAFFTFHRAHSCAHDLCGRLSVGSTKALIRRLAMLRGPIRRRPYNRGEIIAMKWQELIALNDFYSLSGQAVSNWPRVERALRCATRALAGSGWFSQASRCSFTSTHSTPDGRCAQCLNARQMPV
ncbi:Uncharacterized protein ALO35_05427 [Pseudomonas amygdali pv. lachrymans]|uniref:Uncharacterized protein n=2 Tax=Pseudomonas amygdali TaxID=47877 RepID=A0A0P9SI73_PSEAV|nr:Uncharacterized protein ALO35_05427 [Pseudomonas amygdali pv. lachrymans]RMM50319.1 hypothetical protein ALQ79_04990 [Pseudomonas amygdali pv. lachrymans]RMP28791.1 hypothetical protein ALQ26_04930 [Pseudomonas amygdali pv. lachrymans]RMV57213.1 hypothetical protein ALP09_102615 [Pseudomonas amygdali pv. lachrymans]